MHDDIFYNITLNRSARSVRFSFSFIPCGIQEQIFFFSDEEIIQSQFNPNNSKELETLPECRRLLETRDSLVKRNKCR